MVPPHLLQDKKETKSKELYWCELHSRESITARDSQECVPNDDGPIRLRMEHRSTNQWLVISGEPDFTYFSCSVLGRKLRWAGGWAYQFSCWKVFPLNGTEIWTSPTYFIHYPLWAIYPLNSENFHVNLNLSRYSVTCAERIWVSVCTSDVFWASSISEVT